MIQISPSMLSANFADLKTDVEMINNSEADLFHLDIMDGVFVPNISFGFPVISAINKYAKKPLDVHLMIVEPDNYIAEFKKVGAHYLTVHYEVCKHLHRTIHAIKDNGMKAGVSLNPHTSVSLLENIIGNLDMVLLMAVNPGFGGQKFIPETILKIYKLKELISQTGSNTLIEIDGGVDNTNALSLKQAGADILVAGSYIFKSNNPVQTIAGLKNI